MKKYLLTLLYLIPLLAHAGVIELFNGDRLKGDFVKLDGDKLVWKSHNFGKVEIPRANIKNMSTTMPMKISGSRTPCLLDGMKQEYLFYTCGGDLRQHSVPLSALDVMQPYESYIDGDYTFRGKLGLSGFFAQGNDIRQDLKMKTHLEYRRGEFRHTGDIEYASYSSNNEPPDDLWLGRYTLDWFFRERWFWTNDVTLGGDESRGLASYYTLGSGTGYQFWENTKTALSLTAGLTYLSEDYQVPDNPAPDFTQNNRRFAARLGTHFRYQLPLGVAFSYQNEFTRSLDDAADWRLTSGAGLSAMLVGNLYSEIKVDYNVDNQPAQDKRREDTRITAGVSYDW